MASLREFRHDRSTFGFNKSHELVSHSKESSKGAMIIHGHVNPGIIRENLEEEESLPLIEISAEDEHDSRENYGKGRLLKEFDDESSE